MGSREVKSKPAIDLTNIRIKEKSWLAKVAAAKLKADKVAFVLGGTIYLHNVNEADFLDNEKWVRHELCHIRQFQTHGYFIFILKYLWESLLHGYHNNKYEAEARLCEMD